MPHTISTMSAWFWSESIWLPPGITWESIPEHQFTDSSVMYKSIPMAFAFILIRVAFEWSIARPLGRCLGLPDPGSELPNIFKRTYYRARTWYDGRPAHHSRRRVRTMSGVIRPITVMKSRLDKFCECCWRFTYYTSVFIFGVWVLWDKRWFWDAANCFDGYPYQEPREYIDVYYVIEAGFYTSLMISQFFDVQRSDFEMMFVHHVVTLLLIWGSWNVNLVRMGSLIMVIHDCADIALELAKCFRYIEMTTTCDVLFAVFAVNWFATRCVWLPYHVLLTTFGDAPALIVFFPVYYIFNGLLLVLQVLHIMWSYMIAKMVIKALRGEEIDDSRSDDELDGLEMISDSTDNEEPRGKKSK